MVNKKPDDKESSRVFSLWLNPKVKELFDSRRESMKMSSSNFIAYLMDIEKKYDEVAKENEELKKKIASEQSKNADLQSKYQELAEKVEKMVQLEQYIWVTQVPFNEMKGEEIRKIMERFGAYRAAVAAFESGWNRESVSGMLPDLSKDAVEIAGKEAFYNMLGEWIYNLKVEKGLLKTQTTLVTTVEPIEIADYHKTITNPVVSIYYYLWMKARPNYRKDLEGFVVDCVIDSMNSHGVFLTAVLPE